MAAHRSGPAVMACCDGRCGSPVPAEYFQARRYLWPGIRRSWIMTWLAITVAIVDIDARTI
jgi:hypothetical protein